MKSLKKQTSPVRVIIVDGRSYDNTREVVKKYDVLLIDEPPSEMKGSRRGLACNKGLEYSQSELVGFLDSDTEVPPTWAHDLQKHFNDPNVVAVTSGCTGENKTKFGKAINKVLRLGSTHAQRFIEVTEIQSVPGYNSVYRRKAILEVGGFNENIGGCEDWELNYRLRKAGWKLLGIPDSPVLHKERETFNAFWKQMFGYAWSRGRLVRVVHIFTPLHIFPTLTLLGVFIFGIFRPIILFPFLLVWGYMLTVNAFVLAFTVFIISWGVGYIRGLLER